jgi:Chaperone of endosialidase
MSTGGANNAYAATNVYITGTSGAYNQVNAAAFYQTSSRKFKTNIEDYEGDAIEIFNKTTVVSFVYKDNPEVIHYGFIAEDTPIELSTVEQNRMDTNSTVGLLIKAVQQLEARVKKLEGND